MANNEAQSMDAILSLAKRRGFVYPGSDIYGGLANTWDYGPVGSLLKKNIKDLWWKTFVESREDVVGLDTALLMNTKVWEASTHLSAFSDPLVECKECHGRFREDTLESDKCPNCGKKDSFSEPKQFNLMLKTFLGPAEEKANVSYFRPETAQGMFVNFKNVLQTTRVKVPFGLAQIGKAFRNEITPGNFIFRTREFEQMEVEYFVKESDWAEHFEHWRQMMWQWMDMVGINSKMVHELEVPGDELSHYSKRTIDFEFDYPFGRKELYGLSYRTDFDLSRHHEASGQNLKYRDPETNEEYLPHVIEPTWGVDRTVLAVLLSAYTEDGDRVFLKIPSQIAPYKAMISPLLANKPELVKVAREIFDDLKGEFSLIWDDRGNIGKRYYAQDEIGTPYCITVDFDSLEKKDVTVRDRDTGAQSRVPIAELRTFLRTGVWGESHFDKS